MKKIVIIGFLFVFVISLILFFVLDEESRDLSQDEDTLGSPLRLDNKNDIDDVVDTGSDSYVNEDNTQPDDFREEIRIEGIQGIGSPSGSVNGGVASSLTCTLIRPGNIPDVSCSVRSIGVTSVSLIIVNQLGQDIVANLQLAHCSPEENIAGVANNQYKDFVFSCDNTGKNEFEEDLIVTYTINGQQVRVYGFVKGPVSL